MPSSLLAEKTLSNTLGLILPPKRIARHWLLISLSVGLSLIWNVQACRGQQKVPPEFILPNLARVHEIFTEMKKNLTYHEKDNLAEELVKLPLSEFELDFVALAHRRDLSEQIAVEDQVCYHILVFLRKLEKRALWTVPALLEFRNSENFTRNGKSALSASYGALKMILSGYLDAIDKDPLVDERTPKGNIFYNWSLEHLARPDRRLGSDFSEAISKAISSESGEFLAPYVVLPEPERDLIVILHSEQLLRLVAHNCSKPNASSTRFLASLGRRICSVLGNSPIRPVLPIVFRLIGAFPVTRILLFSKT